MGAGSQDRDWEMKLYDVFAAIGLIYGMFRSSRVALSGKGVAFGLFRRFRFSPGIYHVAFSSIEKGVPSMVERKISIISLTDTSFSGAKEKGYESVSA